MDICLRPIWVFRPSVLLPICTSSFFKCLTFGVPLWCSGLRIQHCHCSGSGHCCDLGLIPGLGTSTCHRCGQRNCSLNFFPSSKEVISSKRSNLSLRFHPFQRVILIHKKNPRQNKWKETSECHKVNLSWYFMFLSYKSPCFVTWMKMTGNLGN